MKPFRHAGKSCRRSSGLTLVELSVAMVVAVVAGGVAYALLVDSLNLHAKGVALNVSQQSARSAMLRLVSDVQASATRPQLVDSNLSVVTDNLTSTNTNEAIGPAAGLSFYRVAGGPFAVEQTAQTNQRTVRLIVTNAASTNAFNPYAGDRLIIPSHSIDDTVTGVNANGATVRTLTLSGNVSTPITVSGSSNEVVVAYVARRVSYVVQSGRLIRQTSQSGTNRSSAIVPNVTTPKPFSVESSAGLPDFNSVNIALAARAPGATNGRFRREGARVTTRAYVQGAITTKQ